MKHLKEVVVVFGVAALALVAWQWNAVTTRTRSSQPIDKIRESPVTTRVQRPSITNASSVAPVQLGKRQSIALRFKSPAPDMVGSLTFKEVGNMGVVMTTERPGDALLIKDKTWNPKYQDYELHDPIPCIPTGNGSELRYAGTVSEPPGTMIVPDGSRLCFRMDNGTWVYVCGLGEYQENGKTNGFGSDRTVDSCLTLLSGADAVLREGAARDLGRLTQQSQVPRVVPKLAALLRESAPAIRQAAAEGLAWISTDQELPNTAAFGGRQRPV